MKIRARDEYISARLVNASGTSISCAKHWVIETAWVALLIIAEVDAAH